VAVDAIRREVENLYFPLLDLERAAENQLNNSRGKIDEPGSAIDQYITHVRSNAIPKIGALYQRIVDLSNKRQEEGCVELRRAKSKADLSNRVAFVLYLIGSVLALGGQYFDKIDKKEAVITEVD
jgi:hypothetical protein